MLLRKTTGSKKSMMGGVATPRLHAAPRLRRNLDTAAAVVAMNASVLIGLSVGAEHRG
jgi:hypothetical protein